MRVQIVDIRGVGRLAALLGHAHFGRAVAAGRAEIGFLRADADKHVLENARHLVLVRVDRHGLVGLDHLVDRHIGRNRREFDHGARSVRSELRLFVFLERAGAGEIFRPVLLAMLADALARAVVLVLWVAQIVDVGQRDDVLACLDIVEGQRKDAPEAFHLADRLGRLAQEVRVTLADRQFLAVRLVVDFPHPELLLHVGFALAAILLGRVVRRRRGRLLRHDTRHCGALHVNLVDALDRLGVHLEFVCDVVGVQEAVQIGAIAVRNDVARLRPIEGRAFADDQVLTRLQLRQAEAQLLDIR